MLDALDFIPRTYMTAPEGVNSRAQETWAPSCLTVTDEDDSDEDVIVSDEEKQHAFKGVGGDHARRVLLPTRRAEEQRRTTVASACMIERDRTVTPYCSVSAKLITRRGCTVLLQYTAVHLCYCASRPLRSLKECLFFFDTSRVL